MFADLLIYLNSRSLNLCILKFPELHILNSADFAFFPICEIQMPQNFVDKKFCVLKVCLLTVLGHITQLSDFPSKAFIIDYLTG